MTAAATRGPGHGGAPVGTTSRSRALLAPVSGAVVAGLVTASLHRSGGIDVAPVPLCPFHAVTGLWCPFCGGLRGVAALSHLDLPAALSSNLPLTLALPLVVALWLRHTYRALLGRGSALPAVPHQVWRPLGLLLLLFTIWRNLPWLPLGEWLAP